MASLSESKKSWSGKDDSHSQEVVLSEAINGDSGSSNSSGDDGSSDDGGGHKKLSLIAAAVFIVGEMAGSGVLALPAAVSGTGWAGIFLIILCCLASGVSAIYLGRCWLIIEERWPEYRKSQRDPYSVIGFKAYGPKMRGFVTFNVLIQLFGVAVVFLILCSDLVYDLMHGHTSLVSCDWIIVIGFIACPFMWLGSPADISLIAYGAMSCTAISCVIIVILYIGEGIRGIAVAPSYTESVSVNSFFLSLGTISFAYGGAATFPTFQNYMEDKKQFPKAVFGGFLMMLILYLMVAVGGFALYGSTCYDNILKNLSPSIWREIIDVLMAFHVFCAFLIVINPVNLSIESYLNIPSKFTWNRCLFRTFMCILIIITSLTVPRFGKILNLVGGSTIALTSFILPPIFYMKLVHQVSPGQWITQVIARRTKIILWSIAIVGLFAGIITTVSSIKDIVSPDAFTKPCYL